MDHRDDVSAGAPSAPPTAPPGAPPRAAYGVLAGSVTERLRELGVRAALGATARDLVAMVLRQGMTLTALGVGIGLVTAAMSSRYMADLLFDIRPMDTITYAGVTVTLLCVALAACWLPARRAGQVNPIEILRAD